MKEKYTHNKKDKDIFHVCKIMSKQNTGTLFIALHLIVPHRCFVFYKLKGRPSISKRLQLALLRYSLLQWSGITPAVYPRCVHNVRL